MKINEVTSIVNSAIITQVNITKKAGFHSKARVELMLKNVEDLENMQGLIGKSVTIEDDSTIFMRGTIILVDSFNNIYDYKATIEIISNSIKFDKEKYHRVFQSTKKKWSDIIDVLSKGETKINILDSNFKQRSVSNIIIQNNKTNFEFITDVALKFGLFLFVNDTNKQNNILSLGQFVESSGEKIEVEDMTSYQKTYENKTEILNVTLRKYIEIGKQVNVLNFKYVNIGVEIVYIEDEIYYKYNFYREISKAEEKKIKAETQIQNLGDCKVISNDDPDKKGRLQVEFLEFEDAIKENQIWIDYLPNLTQKEGGIHFYPDKDEIVKVSYSEKECYLGEAYIIGCVRKVKNNLEKIEQKAVKLFNNSIIFEKDKTEFELSKTKIVAEPEKFTKNSKEIEVTSTEKYKQKSKEIEVTSSEKYKQNSKEIEITSTEKIKQNSKETEIVSSSKILLNSAKIDANTNNFNIV